MTLLMRDQENIEKGMKQGRVEGEDKMIELIQKLVEDKRFEDISIMKSNKVYRQELYMEYHID